MAFFVSAQASLQCFFSAAGTQLQAGWAHFDVVFTRSPLVRVLRFRKDMTQRTRPHQGRGVYVAKHIPPHTLRGALHRLRPRAVRFCSFPTVYLWHSPPLSNFSLLDTHSKELDCLTSEIPAAYSPSISRKNSLQNNSATVNSAQTSRGHTNYKRDSPQSRSPSFKRSEEQYENKHRRQD